MSWVTNDAIHLKLSLLINLKLQAQTMTEIQYTIKLVSLLVEVLSPVNHCGLYQG